MEQPVWKKLKTLVRRLVHDSESAIQQYYNIMAKRQTKGPIYQFGVQLPRNIKEAYEFHK